MNENVLHGVFYASVLVAIIAYAVSEHFQRVYFLLNAVYAFLGHVLHVERCLLHVISDSIDDGAADLRVQLVP